MMKNWKDLTLPSICLLMIGAVIGGFAGNAAPPHPAQLSNSFYRTQFFAGSVITNPTNGQVLITTGAINEGRGSSGAYIIIQPVATCTVNATFKVQLWDGSAEVTSFNIAILANSSTMLPFVVPLQVPNGDSIRILNIGTTVGQVQAAVAIGVTELYF